MSEIGTIDHIGVMVEDLDVAVKFFHETMGLPVDRRIDLPGGPAAITAGAGAVWVAGEEDGVVTRLDLHSGAALKQVGVGNGPAALAVGYGGVWVANRDDGTV